MRSLLLPAVLLMSAPVALAQLSASAQPGAPAQPSASTRPLLQALDTNGDGALSSEEIQRATESLLVLDRNHDGQLSPDEYLAVAPGGEKAAALHQSQPVLLDAAAAWNGSEAMHSLDPLIVCLDVDHDGTLTAAELASAPGALKTLDVNADGILQAEEMRLQRSSPGERAAELLDRWDRNRDGVLSRREVPASLRRQFTAIDTNGDGKLNVEELTTWYATQTAPGSGNAPRNDAPAAQVLPLASRKSATPTQPR